VNELEGKVDERFGHDHHLLTARRNGKLRGSDITMVGKANLDRELLMISLTTPNRPIPLLDKVIKARH